MARETPESPLPPSRMPTRDQVLELLTGAFADSGYDIEDVRVTAGATPPRIVVVADGDHGLDLDVVAELSRVASELLDAHDQDAGAYVLEVTSPGVDRPLTTGTHFRRAHGRKIALTLADGSALSARVGVTDGTHVDLVIADRGRLSVRRTDIANITKAVVQVEFSPPNRQELELAGVAGVSKEGTDA